MSAITQRQGDDERAEEHAQEVISYHARPDGTTDAPMRTANARIDLAMVSARRGDLDAAVNIGMSAFDFQRKSLSDLIARGEDLERILRARYHGESLANDFHERWVAASRRP
jgi:hypothetical protein